MQAENMVDQRKLHQAQLQGQMNINGAFDSNNQAALNLKQAQAAGQNLQNTGYGYDNTAKNSTLAPIAYLPKMLTVSGIYCPRPAIHKYPL